MKTLLGLGLALSLLLNAALLFRKPQPPAAPVVRPQVIQRTVIPEPQIIVVPPTDSAPVPGIVPAPAIVAVAPVVQLLAGPSDVPSGGQVTVTCTVLSGKTSSRHWIGLYAVGADVSSYSAYRMIDAAAQVAFKAPRAAGTYEFRYILEDDATTIAASNPFRVYEEPFSRPMVDLQSGTTTVRCGQEIPAGWSLLSGRRSPQDWIGLYVPGARNEDYLTWRYVTDADRGQVMLQAPDKPGMYEMRYLLDNGHESVATSIRIVVVP
jgi:Ca-activated chloride channel homolog